MKMELKGYTLTIVLFLFSSVSDARSSGPFSGHSVVRVTPMSEFQLIHLVKVLDTYKSVDVWKYPSYVEAPVDLRLSPLNRDNVTKALLDAGIQPITLMSDVQAVIDEQASERKRTSSLKSVLGFDYTRYHTLDEINVWIENITTVHNNMASVFDVTTSYEGRPLKAIKISTQPQNAKNVDRPSFWIGGGSHAREWISPATVMYIVGQMLDEYRTDQSLAATVDKFDWYILPVINPDGYVYSWKDSGTRMWRKTRSKHGICTGVNLNRNWDADWCAKGGSRFPCSPNYCGPNAFSEVEAKGVADYIKNIGNVKAFIDFYSYNQLWMSPHAYTRTQPNDFTKQNNGSAVAVAALKNTYDTVYSHGTIASLTYLSSGRSVDWTYDAAGVVYSYMVELRDTGKYGYLLPADQIVPCGIETLEGLLALADYIADN